MSEILHTHCCKACDNLKSSNHRMRDALEAVDIYFKALVEQWAANDGRLVSESGTIIRGSEDIERLCEIAARKTRAALENEK